MRIAFDIDGVLADWNSAFRDLLEEQTRKKPKVWPPDKWAWPNDYCTGAEIHNAWGYIDSTRGTWWADLEPLYKGSGASERKALIDLSKHHDLYFMTARYGAGVKRVTEGWIEDYYAIWPTVLVGLDPQAKAAVMKALDIDVMVDDRPENVIAAYRVDIDHPIIYDQPWNKEMGWSEKTSTVRRLGSLAAVAELVKGIEPHVGD